VNFLRQVWTAGEDCALANWTNHLTRRIRRGKGGFRCTGAHVPKFHPVAAPVLCELRNVMGAGKLIMLVPLIDLKSLTEFSACAAGTSNRRH
jgi:hypothetical protein